MKAVVASRAGEDIVAYHSRELIGVRLGPVEFPATRASVTSALSKQAAASTYMPAPVRIDSST